MESNSVLDTDTLGASLRAARIRAGYQKASDLATAITNKTGYRVAESTIYKVETGMQEPKLSLYLAMMRVLFPDNNLEISEIIKQSLPSTWQIPLNQEIRDWAISINLSGSTEKQLRSLNKSLLELEKTFPGITITYKNDVAPPLAIDSGTENDDRFGEARISFSLEGPNEEGSRRLEISFNESNGNIIRSRFKVENEKDVLMAVDLFIDELPIEYPFETRHNLTKKIIKEMQGYEPFAWRELKDI